MSQEWATTWGVSLDNETGVHELHWTDDQGSHVSTIHPPGSGLTPCEARTVTKARHDLICGRVTEHDGCHVSTGNWRRLGSVAD